jgi:hypothetical protein
MRGSRLPRGRPPALSLRRLACLALAAAFGAGVARGAPAAGAEDGSHSRIVFAERAWEVRLVDRPGTRAFCMARSGGADSFVALYAPAPDRLRMQFYSEAWNFGDGGRVALMVAVDRGAPWALGDATAFRQSALFDLPQSRAGADFLKAMMGGTVLRLGDRTGRPVGRYSLAGSGAAIGALAACVRGL